MRITELSHFLKCRDWDRLDSYTWSSPPCWHKFHPDRCPDPSYTRWYLDTSSHLFWPYLPDTGHSPLVCTAHRDCPRRGQHCSNTLTSDWGLADCPHIGHLSRLSNMSPSESQYRTFLHYKCMIQCQLCADIVTCRVQHWSLVTLAPETALGIDTSASRTRFSAKWCTLVIIFTLI